MTRYVALVRAVNVAGTGRLPNEELRAMGEACGFEKVRTYVNSGNLLFASDLPEAPARRALEERLCRFFGRRATVHLRSESEMAAALRDNPFKDDLPGRVLAHFIADPPEARMIEEARDVGQERLALGPRLIYVSYGEGIGGSKLKLPAIKEGTARNMNSVARIAELLAGL